MSSEKWDEQPVKTAPVTDDEILIIDSEDVNPATQSKRVTLGNLITGQTLKATPVDADEILITDSADSSNLKKTTLTSLLADINQTPWLTDINANNKRLLNIDDLEFDDLASILAGSLAYITFAASNMRHNVPTGDGFLFTVNNITQFRVRENDISLKSVAGSNLTIIRSNQTSFDRFLDIPDLPGTSTIAIVDLTQTLTNKTLGTSTSLGADLAGAQNDITDIQLLQLRHTLNNFRPELEFFQDQATPASTNNIGKITFYGNNSVSSKTEYGEIRTIIADPNSTTEDGQLELRANVGGAGLSSMLILNEFGNDQIDFYRDADWNGNEITNAGLIASRRIQGLKGSDVASADAITLGNGNYFDITGAVTINHMIDTNWQAGSTVTLQFDSTATLTNAAGGATGAEQDFALAGAVNFVATAGDTVTLVNDGTLWREVSRSVN